MAMDAPEVSVKDILEEANVGVFAAPSGWSLNIGRLPVTPETAIACVVTGGQSPWPHLLLNFPSIQVLVRGAKNGYMTAQSKAREVVDTLLGIPVTTTAGGDKITGITQIGDVSFVGYDASDCPMFSCNFSLIMEPQAGGHRSPIS